MKAKTLTYKGFSVGDTVFFYYHNVFPCEEGVIKEVVENVLGNDIWFKIHWESGEVSCVPYERVFKSKELCMEYAQSIRDKRFESFKKQITDMDSLIEFCVKSIKCSEFDNEAIKAIKEKYEEFKKCG